MEKPMGNARNPFVPADRGPMLRSRATPAIAAGLVALVCAIAAVLSDQIWLLVGAAVLAVISALIVIDWHRQYVARREARAELAEDAARLMKESDEALSRAARFEAEAIAAREQLAKASLVERPARAGDRPWTFGDDPRSTVRAQLAAYPPDPEEEEPLGTAPDDTVEDESPGPALDPRDAAQVHDQVSGVFNQAFFEASLEKRISAARRGLRPLTYALVEVRCHLGQPEERQADPGPVADILVATLREADTVARTAEGLFALLLEDTPENGAVWTLERIRRRINEDLEHSTMQAGISCYPAHAFDADQMTYQVRQAMEAAREWHQDRIEVTPSAPDD